MELAVASVWKVVKEFEGTPAVSDFLMLREGVSLTLQPGEILLEALYISVDPYMRIEPGHMGEDKTMFGDQVARVSKSSNESFPEGCLVVANVGWRTLTSLDPSHTGSFGPIVRRLPSLGDLPPSLGLGCLGMPGLTAYFGLLERGQPQVGHTVMVSGAAGAVGSVAGQLAKIKGCKVIGSAGSQAKCDWLRKLGFDGVFNYKERAVDEALTELAPGGIDLYYDNVGGDMTYSVVSRHMKFGGRVVICGAISTYTDKTPMVRDWSLHIVENQLTVIGTNVTAFIDRYPQATEQLLEWIHQGRLKFRETVTEGFEHAPQAFASLFSGANIGKAVVKV